MKVEDAVREFLRSLVEILKLTDNVEVDFEIDSLDNIIQNVWGVIQDYEKSDNLEVIFDILGNQEKEIFNKNVNEYCKIKDIYIIYDSIRKSKDNRKSKDKDFEGKVRDFSFADVKGRGAVISKSFFVNIDFFKDILNENDFEELKGNIFELIVYLGSRAKRDEKKRFLNFLLKNYVKNHFVLIRKDESLNKEELYSFLYLNYLAKDYKTKLDAKVVYKYNYQSRIVKKIESLSTLELSQFFEIFDVFDEYQHATDILSRFLKLYQIIEYLLIRVIFVKIQQRTGQHKQFLRELMGMKKHDDFDKKLFKELFENEKSDLKNWFKNLATNQSIKDEIERYLNKSVDITQNDDEYWLNLLADLLYQLRNSIVHNKESEHHITIHATTSTTADLLKKILLKFEKIILKKLVEYNEKISYTSRYLWLY